MSAVLTCDVAIVGAGPTGLTLANALGAADVRTILIERNDTTVQEPRAVSIDDESLRTMQALDVHRSIMDDVIPASGYHCFGPDGSCFLRVEPRARPYGFPRRSNFRQPDLEATLRGALARFAHVTALFGHVCKAIGQDAEAVRLELETPGGEATISARYVVGCDGAHSTIRRAMDASLHGSTYRQRWLILDLAATRETFKHSRVLCNPRRPAITLAGPHDTRRYEFMLHDDEPDEVVTTPEFARELLARHGPDAGAPVSRQRVYTFHARIADRWRDGRLFIAGDAAHLSPPFAGQGMNSGIRDAHNLGWKLAHVLHHRLGAGLLDSYERERKPHAWALIQMAVSIGRVMMPTSPLQAALVRLGFRAAGLVPPLQAYFAEMKYKPTPLYSEGFLIPARGLEMIGRMMPQPTMEFEGGHSRPLDDSLGAGFALVACGGNAEETMAASRRYDFNLGPMRRLAVLPASADAARGRYGDDMSVGRDLEGSFTAMARRRPLMLLVRPDRYILGAITVDSQASVEAFAQSVRTLVARTWQPAEAARTERQVVHP